MNIVKQSLILCIGVLLALIGLQGIQSMWQVNRLSNATEDIGNRTRLAAESRDLLSSFATASGQLKSAIAFVDASSAEDNRKQFAAKAAALTKDAEKVHALAGSDTRAAADEVASAIQQWTGMATKHLSADGETQLPSYQALDDAQARVQQGIAAMVQRSEEAVRSTLALSHDRARATLIWTAVELVVAVGLGIALGWLALRSLRQQLGGDASEVAAVATAVAAGDLMMKIRTEGLREDSVMAATARMQRSLTETVGRVRNISETLLDGADEIVAGNHDLSARTEQQASALERTASTMEQLGATVRHNADNAREANTLTHSASQVAEKGGAIIERVVATMQGITASSKKIADITGVIDGIAFQTNILALNAAVEAARAGEQGKGFAVVASEVRSLAQRSAEAAKEIKALIGASVDQVESGAVLVGEAGTTMQEIVGAVQRVSSIMHEISNASDEQRTGVMQVGEVVHELDRATQQNAALAEQRAAAAESLRGRAVQLVDAVSVFRLQPASTQT